MQRTERRATRNDGRITTRAVANIWHHFMMNIIVELHVTNDFMSRINLIIHPAFVINAVDGIYFYFSLVNKRSKCIYQLKALVLQIICGSSRYQQECKSIMTISYNWHLLI